ncbi:hypothetical protein [Microbacterium tenebrionis]|uniref:hypothetical protein n=1 Tax=Microbacterium tenebrionis TaxID=2830665 RepID=UPI00158AE873|nr:hypothetical protein [Microbacterium ihumii]
MASAGSGFSALELGWVTDADGTWSLTDEGRDAKERLGASVEHGHHPHPGRGPHGHGHKGHGHGRARVARFVQSAYERGFDAGFTRGRDDR